MTAGGRKGVRGRGSGDWFDDDPWDIAKPSWESETTEVPARPWDDEGAGEAEPGGDTWSSRSTWDDALPQEDDPADGHLATDRMNGDPERPGASWTDPRREEPAAGSWTDPRASEPRSGRVRIIGAFEAGGGAERDDAASSEVGDVEGPGTAGADEPMELPHWTEPATGEVPAVLLDEGADGDAWATTTQQAPVWREHQSEWEEVDEILVELASDEPPEGALDGAAGSQRPGDFDDLEDVSREKVEQDQGRRHGATMRPHARRAPREREAEPTAAAAEGLAERRVGASIASGVAFGAVALVCLVAGPLATAVLSAAVLTVAAAELLGVLRRGGFKPATLLILLATPLSVFAGYSKGEPAVVLVVALVVAFSFLWSLAGISRERPLIDTGVSLLTFAWIGFLGAFAGLLLAPGYFPHRHGIAYFGGVALLTVAYDIGALVVGRWIGHRQLAPLVSPGKTWEGAAGGTLLAIVVAVAVVGRIAPWSMGRAAVLAIVVAVAAPFGDLVESLVKRDLALKDMGSFLPGHGGILDRIDGLLFAMPAAFYILRLLHAG